MKFNKTLTIFLFSSVVFFYACDDKAKASKQETSTPVEAVDSQTSPASPNPTTPNPTTKEPAQNTSGVWHYTCSKGCPGGAGSAENCSNCGGLLAHNTAYHSNSTPSSAPFAPGNAPQANTPTPEPSQNAAGVWHYTCGSGCSGGSGSAGNCGTCGNALSHNTNYHN